MTNVLTEQDPIGIANAHPGVDGLTDEIRKHRHEAYAEGYADGKGINAEKATERDALVEAARQAGWCFRKDADGRYQMRPLMVAVAHSLSGLATEMTQEASMPLVNSVQK